jgi:hypothetical protein
MGSHHELLITSSGPSDVTAGTLRRIHEKALRQQAITRQGREFLWSGPIRHRRSTQRLATPWTTAVTPPIANKVCRICRR